MQPPTLVVAGVPATSETATYASQTSRVSAVGSLMPVSEACSVTSTSAPSAMA